MEEIVNKVKESGLIQMDLATYKPKVQLIGLDIAPQLWEGLILREKPFREWIKSTDWAVYSEKAIYLFCSAEAIVPVWAYMLISSQLQQVNASFIVGSKEELEKMLVKQAIESENLDAYKDQRIIVKGCSDISNPEYAMSVFVNHFQPIVKSIMFGEPCSTVPIFKRK